MNYRSAVAEAKRLIKRSEEDQWRLSELTHQVLTSGTTTVTKWAKDLGVSHRHVGTLRDMWARYGGQRGRSNRTFAEFYQMARVSEQEADRLAKIADETGRSVTTVERSLRHGDKVEMARKLLAEPEVVEDVIREPTIRAKVVRAGRTVDEEQEERAAAREQEQRPRLRQRGLQYEIIGELTSIRYKANKVLDKIRDLEVDEEVSESILEALEEVENSIGWIRSYLESGDRSFDDALDRMLREGS